MKQAKHRQTKKEIIINSFSWVLLLKCRALFLQGFSMPFTPLSVMPHISRSINKNKYRLINGKHCMTFACTVTAANFNRKVRCLIKL